MNETSALQKGGKKETSTFCLEVCRGRFGSCLECVVDHVAFENWLKRNYQENEILAQAERR
jgi:hypothetical protein